MADIKVYGTFRNETESSKIAYASQIWDETKNKSQAEINEEGGGFGKFRFAHWNVGHFTYYDGIQGDDTPDIPAADSPTMALRYNTALNEINADVLGICEDDTIFDAVGTETLPLLYNPKWMTCHQGTKYNYMCASLYANLPLSNIVVQEVMFPQTVQSNRYYKLMTAKFNGKEVKFVETHLDFDQGSHGAEYRALQIQKLINDFADSDYVVIAADFNVANPNEWDAFAQAGYKMANHGYIGDKVTHINHMTQGEYVLDNIVAKGFQMSDIKVWDDTFDLSDHCAISCDLQMLI